jgi:hypothetical protein
MFETRRRWRMQEKRKEFEIMPVEDLALSNAYQLEALICVLEKKGLLTKKEVLKEIEAANLSRKK